LWLRSLENPAGQIIPGTDAPTWPFWSPDGRFIGFFAGGKLKRVDLQGAPPQTLADAPGGLGGSWNGEDVIVFAAEGAGPLFQIPAAGGAAVAVTALNEARQETSHRHPWFLPDGRHFLYLAISSKPENSGVFVGSLDSKESTRLASTALRAAFAAPDHLLFMRESTLMAQRFDPDRRQLSGSPFPVAEDIGVNAPNSAAGFAVSRNGTLIYRSDDPELRVTKLTWFDREGNSTPALPTQAEYRDPALSPDGRFIAVAKVDRGGTLTADLWIVDLQRGTETRFTFDPGLDRLARWSPDGSFVAFNRNGAAGNFELYRKNVSGVQPEELLLQSNLDVAVADWTPDGESVLYQQNDPKTLVDLLLLPLAGEKKPEPLVRSPFTDTLGRISPDGRWLAYQSNESGRPEVYVVQFPVARTRTQISTAGGNAPHWRADGKELFFNTVPSAIMAVDIGVSSSGELQPGVPKKLFDMPGAQGRWDVAADGRRFLVNVADQSGLTNAPPLRVVLNWNRQTAP
jgi:Tol biopolymer transport system component